MYLSHYKLESKPFQMSTDPNFLWLGEKHKEALATLKYAIVENKGILALTGDVGTGKTTLINALIQSLGDDTMVATIYDPSLEVLDFFNIVSVAFNMGKTFDSKGEFLIYFKRFLKEVRAQNKKVLLIIDEAQRINNELLEEIRLLSNLEDEHVRLLNIFFVGQNEFIDILKKYKNRALRQRITIRYHIEPLTLSETEAYTRHRLKIGGARARIFSSGAIQEIFSFSNGYPRLINIICDHALLSGYVREIIIINADIIRECKEELQISNLDMGQDTDSSDYESESKRKIPVIQRVEKPRHREIRIRSMAIGIGFLVVIGSVAGYVFYNNAKTKTEPHANLASRQGKTSYPGQAEQKNNLQTTVPPAPEKKTYDVPARVEIGKEGDSSFYITRSPEPKLFKETDIKKEEIPETTQPKAKPVKVQKKRLDKDRAKPDFLKKKDLSPEKDRTIDKKAIKVKSAPSEKQVITVMAKSSDNVQKPAVAAAPEKDKQSVKTSVISESVPDGVAVPAKKPEEKKVAVLPKEPEENKVAVPAKKPEENKVAVPAKEPEENKVVVNVEQKAVPAFRKGIKSERGTGDSFAHEDLQSHLNAFLTEYCRTYEKEQLDKFATFFEPDAVENGKSFTSRLAQYRRTFEKVDSMNYRIELTRYAVQEGTGVIRIEGIFHVRAKFGGSGKWREKSGPITMKLVSHGGSFRVKWLGY